MNRIVALSKWNPNLSSSGQNRKPEWTQLYINNLKLMNSIEIMEWINPIQIEICEYCGMYQCSSNGYSWISRIRDTAIFTEPTIEEIPENITSSLVKNNHIYLTRTEWDKTIDTVRNSIQWSELPISKYWNIYSYIMLNSPISGIQNLYKYDDEIKNQIIFVENYEQGKFINIIEYIKNKNVYDKDIEEKDIYLLNENYIPVNIYFNNGNEWNGFYSFNDELYYNIGKDWLWKFHLTIAST